METTKHEETFTATEADVTRDTPLRQAPGPGSVGFWAASDQSDGTMSIRVAGRTLADAILVPNRGTNAPIKEQEEAPMAVTQVGGGELIEVDYTEVTAALSRLVVIFMGIRTR